MSCHYARGPVPALFLLRNKKSLTCESCLHVRSYNLIGLLVSLQAEWRHADEMARAH